jgi:MHS family shikimate/dehydroshikimate transporter-like MFS transporter
MYIVTTFALGYSVAKLGMSRDLFLNITFAVGVISCFSLPFFGWLADRIGFKRVYITGAVIGVACTFPFFFAMEAKSVFWIVAFSLLLANVAHDMVNSVQQPLFTSLFGTEYRYSGANLGYQIASVVFGGFTPFIATALLGINGTWYPVAIYMTLGCLLSVVVAWGTKMQQG